MMLTAINNKFDDLDEFTTFRSGLDAYLKAVSTVFDQAPTTQEGLIELHASILRHACNGPAPKEHLAAAAVVFGLTRAVQQARRVVPGYAVRNTVAYTVAATRHRVYEAEHAELLELARSWMAHAYLVGEVECGGPR
ncbi:hypothetical protein [Amycolatopsis sp. FDAARGOS 1241]|uniref:hypothetical protein n=1 Tax=Amycolatopsis sp. FDAARGOS 1241 TaxID=2778070 RepID=UPI00194E0E73|nr:hypothetical protein [Amycolatopsis sp. FDAARGOS 1241]QRP46044.1 hypothetical protein I6J71_44530 [Amycolatopsis sp. FDAARGOS 1241]